jgi:hypothetical protein
MIEMGTCDVLFYALNRSAHDKFNAMRRGASTGIS